MLFLDTPVNHKQQRKAKEDHSSVGDCPTSPLSHVESPAVASPSISAVVDALHLSDIDWDALSFTSSPAPQSAANHSGEPKMSKATDSEVKETEGESTKQEASGDVKESDSRSAPELCYLDCPLRERVLMKITAKAVDKMAMHSDVVSELRHYEGISLRHTSAHNSNPKPNGQIPSKDYNDSDKRKTVVYKKEPLTDKSQCTTNHAKTETHNSKQQLRPALQAKSNTKDKCNGSQKPPQKYKFIKTAISSSTVPQQRCHSDPVQSDKNMLQTTKRSVCMSMPSSSDESDAENQQFGPQRQAKIKPMNKMKGGSLSDVPLKPVCAPKTTKSTAKVPHTVQLSQIKALSCSAETETPASTKNEDVSPAHVDGDVFLQTPASPVTVLDSDDSVISCDSPLPLAERLRLKFLK